MIPITWQCTTRSDLPPGHVMMVVRYDDGKRKFTLPRYFDAVTLSECSFDGLVALLHVDALHVLALVKDMVARLDGMRPHNALTGNLKCANAR